MGESRDAWIEIPSQEDLRPFFAGMPYDFGFFPAMARLAAAHPEIGPAFGMLFAQIMFAPERALTRGEREMVAAVASAAQDCFY